ncbi:MAG: hypothetical protein J6M06_00710 [Synergistaceae bacterium]|nr:hypothetical protein [Synergistaceae bacterium]
MATSGDILNSYKSSINNTLSDIGNSRIGQTVSGGAKNSLSSDVNTAADIYGLTQGARDTMMNEYVSDSASSLKQAKHDLALLEQERARARTRSKTSKPSSTAYSGSTTQWLRRARRSAARHRQLTSLRTISENPRRQASQRQRTG